jgi:hypothetical protein
MPPFVKDEKSRQQADGKITFMDAFTAVQMPKGSRQESP